MSSFIYVGNFGYFIFPDNLTDEKLKKIFTILFNFYPALSCGEIDNTLIKPIYVPFEKTLPKDVIFNVFEVYNS